VGTPPPCAVQNLENKRSKFRLCARSLSLQELHAKSREHGSYGWGVEGRGSVLELRLEWQPAEAGRFRLSPGSDYQRSSIIL
jgi:hypothetical protein